jgi:uncharacterized membrane protein
MPAKAKKVEKESKKDGWIYILIYFFTWLTGLIFYLVEKEDKKIRFHAMQSILLGVVMFVISIPLITAPLSFLLWLYGLYVGYKESQGETIRIPYLADFADKYV